MQKEKVFKEKDGKRNVKKNKDNKNNNTYNNSSTPNWANRIFLSNYERITYSRRQRKF